MKVFEINITMEDFAEGIHDWFDISIGNYVATLLYQNTEMKTPECIKRYTIDFTLDRNIKKPVKIIVYYDENKEK